ncbi:MAG: hypothetical protein EBR82_72565 [Caulobacteraceae bacterium]|nr:hypothetical protein [Caulobacteraceae bacterium]
MTDIELKIAYALAGALVVWGERNDTREFGFMRTAQWTALELFGLYVGMAKWHGDVEIWRVVLASGIFMALLTAGHSMILSPPGSPLPSNPNWLETQVIKMGGSPQSMWWFHAFFRYGIGPVFIGALLNSPLYSFVGFAIVVGYWPIAYWINPIIKGTGETTKFTGALICGFVMYGGLVINV